jgi:hypothetical protein
MNRNTNGRARCSSTAARPDHNLNRGEQAMAGTLTTTLAIPRRRLPIAGAAPAVLDALTPVVTPPRTLPRRLLLALTAMAVPGDFISEGLAAAGTSPTSLPPPPPTPTFRTGAASTSPPPRLTTRALPMTPMTPPPPPMMTGSVTSSRTSRPRAAPARRWRCLACWRRPGWRSPSPSRNPRKMIAGATARPGNGPAKWCWT